MLSRRILRVKVFQNLYALHCHRQANLQKAKNEIEAFFINKKVTQGFDQKEAIKIEKEKAINYFEDMLKEDQESKPYLESKIQKHLDIVFVNLKNNNRLSSQAIYKTFVTSYKSIFETYRKLFIFFKLLANKVDNIYKETINNNYVSDQIKQNFLEFSNFKKQPFSIYLFQNQDLHTYQNNLIHTFDQELINLSFKDLKNQPVFKSFIEDKTTELSKSVQQAKSLFKFLLKKDKPLYLHLEESDLCWKENQLILMGFLKKKLSTHNELDIFKDISEDIEDKEFIDILFYKSIASEKENVKYISEQSHKWALNRLTKNDKILLNMAMTELLHCPNIPVKVTINEYIEIAKKYSTPKSGLFINGILDAYHNHMQETKLLIKTGRGLYN